MRIAIVGTGGSLAMSVDDPLELHDYPTRSRFLTVPDLLEAVPEIATLADVTAVDPLTVRSTAITPADWLALARLVREVADSDPRPDGIVVTHGTATLEETAYFLDLTLDVEQTVVLVAAMRPMGGMSSDGPLNLVNGVRVALADSARGLGVLVVINERIHAARDAAKLATHRLDAFSSGDSGPLGWVAPNGDVRVERRPLRGRPRTVDVADLSALPRVDIAYSYAGADGTAVRALVDAGAAGLVIAGYPPGRPAAAQEAAITEAVERGVAVVMSTRAGDGRVLPSDWAAERRIVVSDGLSPQKARILTMLGLCGTRDPAVLQALFLA